MKAFLKKKQLMTLALVGALGLAVYLNYTLSGEPALSAGTEASTPEEDDRLGDATFVGGPVSEPDDGTAEGAQTGEQEGYFAVARANRTAAREEALSILQEVLDNSAASKEEKTAATQQAAAIAENILQESNIESLLTAKGFTDSVVYLSEGKCSVVVASAELTSQQSMQILQIVLSQATVEAANVAITAQEA